MRFVICRFIAVFAWLALGSLARGEVSVSARLSHRSTEVGSPVQLEVEVKGASSEVEPPEVKVDGLEVNYVGPSSSQRVEFVNGRVSTERSTTHVFRVVPQRAGELTVPPLWLVVDGRPYKTEPVVLKVDKAREPAAAGSGEARAFAEIVVRKKAAYVGEVLPVEVRFYLDMEAGFDGDMNVPSLGENGFTAQKFPQPQQQLETRGGREYRVIIFRTAVTPTKAGKLMLGPSEIPFVAQMPAADAQEARGRRRNDPFGMLFDDFFSGRRRNPAARYVAKAAGVEIEVKPLPAEGRPKSFSGAVGNFQFAAEGSPAQVKMGEPVTMKLTVTGEGSFDRVQAPAIDDARGWKSYDPSEKFAPGDELKMSGTKVFEILVIPEEKHEWMPRFEFSYFDPVKAEYVTLRSRPEPLVVIGEPLATPAPAPAVSSSASATPTPVSAKRTMEIAGIHYEQGRRGTFAPIHRRSGFWIANGAAGLLALSLLTSRRWRRDAALVRVRMLRSERDELWRAIRGGRGEFFDRAARLVQVQTALVSGAEPAAVDASAAAKELRLEESAARDVAAIFDARAERVYAGDASASGSVPASERERFIAVLERLCGR